MTDPIRCDSRTLTGDLTCALPAFHAGPHAGGIPAVEWNDPSPATRDPYDLPVHYQVLLAGLRAIAADAVARDDHHTAAYAHSVLAGEPIPPQDDPDDDPDGEDYTQVATATTCGAYPVRVRLPTGCDHAPDHSGPHYTWWADDTGEHSMSWDALPTHAAPKPDRWGVAGVLAQVARDRTQPYWSDRQDTLDAVQTWAESLRDQIGDPLCGQVPAGIRNPVPCHLPIGHTEQHWSSTGCDGGTVRWDV